MSDTGRALGTGRRDVQFTSDPGPFRSFLSVPLGETSVPGPFGPVLGWRPDGRTPVRINLDRSGPPSSPSPPRPPTPTDRGPRRRGTGPSSYCLWQRFLLQRPCERRKTANFLQMHAKNVSFLFHRGTRNPSLKNIERWCFTLRSNFPPAMSRLFGNRAKTAK